MNFDPSLPFAADCDTIQLQLSELADSGAPLPPDLQAHVASCPACAAFAEQWLSGPPAELARQIPQASDKQLRERIMASTKPNVIRFPTPAASRSTWSTLLTRIAACLAVAGFAYWLLDPVASSVRPRTVSTSGSVLTQGLELMENKTKHEQEVIQTALVDGGAHVTRNVNWTMSALE